MPPPTSTSTQATTASSQTTHRNWVRAAETTLQRLQADIDDVHRQTLAMNTANSTTSDSDDDDASSHKGSTRAQTCSLGELSIVDRIPEFNFRIMRLLLQVWHVELNGLCEEHMGSLGLRIMMTVHDWETLKDSIREDV
ncbi:uncharacterized protein BKCO1_900099 [Diplodia corticola]|uniref:Uncharacterized protein n=1 Tax=Diplodia corticola TaxID=236234 RepID=A0A1J9R8T3_9PEZI|nr:uncharacterized protein BKCO1_900099 [Diplodia corticola]OJD36929.1 hypothetical protein BKCO1_900099 [Diplodia corticola]